MSHIEFGSEVANYINDICKANGCVFATEEGTCLVKGNADVIQSIGEFKKCSSAAVRVWNKEGYVVPGVVDTSIGFRGTGHSVPYVEQIRNVDCNRVEDY